MIKRPLSDAEAGNLALDLLSDHARLQRENQRLRAALEELSEYSHDCNHDVIARRALLPEES